MIQFDFEILISSFNYRNSFGANFVQKDQNRCVRRALHFLDGPDQPTIVYPVGRHIGIRNIINNDMKFKQHDTITGMYVS